MKFVEQQVDAELKAEAAREAGTKKPPTSRVYRYHPVALESARMIHRATDLFITNPRDITDRSLVTQDTEWVADFARYLQEFDYRKSLKEKKQS